MAKTTGEIFKDLDEWIDENPERSVMIIAGAEEEDIVVKQRGKKSEVVTCVASAMENIPEVEELITKALDILKEYRKDKQKTEDN
jgi:hypothetical protein